MPGTESPALTELADFVAVAVREALLADPQPQAVARYTELAPYDTEVIEVCLAVMGNSPHPAEKFGCTSCHQGQGSATDFTLATHSPNTASDKKRWQGQHEWMSIHDWEYPMLPSRFIESSCLKCHYQVTDLVREGSQVEAPKVFKGYNLVRELGCFGCHEISGVKSGRSVGPDPGGPSAPRTTSAAGRFRQQWHSCCPVSGDQGQQDKVMEQPTWVIPEAGTAQRAGI